jgi:hypothetical protein
MTAAQADKDKEKRDYVYAFMPFAGNETIEA